MLSWPNAAEGGGLGFWYLGHYKISIFAVNLWPSGMAKTMLAAIFKIILPKENAKDIPEIPDKIREGMKFLPVTNMDEAIKKAFGTQLKTRKKRSVKTKIVNKRSTPRRPSATTLN